jgi:hypothetical protein
MMNLLFTYIAAFCRKASAFTVLCLCSSLIYAYQIVPVIALQSAPVLDGSDSDWGPSTLIEVPLHQTHPNQQSKVEKIFIKGAVFADKVYFYFTWQDDTHSVEHKPFLWDRQQKRYIQSQIFEDRLAIQFAMSGDYTTNWFSGNEFVADMWHWKSFRSNTLGLAQDKQTIISKTKMLRSFQGQTPEGDPIYIYRPSDEGYPLYKSIRYKEKQESKMPKYLLAKNPQGSIADVKAKGVWRDGAWHIEIARSINTNHEDDVVFIKGRQVLGGIAVFNNTGDDDHSISDTLIFEF